MKLRKHSKNYFLLASVIEVIDISNEEEVKDMMLRIPKPTLYKVAQTHVRKLLQKIVKMVEGKNITLR
jgi:hypothetical protein